MSEETIQHLCAFPDCRDLALYEYRHRNGRGYLCDRHLTARVRGEAKQGRTVSYAPLRGTPEPAPARSELIKARATIMTLEEEISDGKRRLAEFYDSNKKLAAETQGLHLRNRELEQQAKDAMARADAAEANLAERVNELAAAKNEVLRLEAIMPNGKTLDTIQVLEEDNRNLRQRVLELQKADHAST